MSQSQFEFNIHQGFDVKDVASKYEGTPLVNNKGNSEI
jgi:hypothetical protein